MLFALAGGHIDRIFDGCLEYGVKIIRNVSVEIRHSMYNHGHATRDSIK